MAYTKEQIAASDLMRATEKVLEAVGHVKRRAPADDQAVRDVEAAAEVLIQKVYKNLDTAFPGEMEGCVLPDMSQDLHLDLATPYRELVETLPESIRITYRWFKENEKVLSAFVAAKVFLPSCNSFDIYPKPEFETNFEAIVKAVVG